MMQICTHVTRAGGDEGLQVQSMADRMVQYARACMMSITRVSPFESEFFLFFFGREGGGGGCFCFFWKGINNLY